MSSAALEAQDTVLQIGTGSGPVVYTTIAEIKSISGPGGSAAVKDVTDLQSTGKEKRMGLLDEGQLTFNMFYQPANTQHALLRTQRAARAETPFRLIFTDAGNMQWDFNAFVAGFQLSGIEVDGMVEAQVTLEITGAITETP